MGFITKAEVGFENENYLDCDSDLELEIDRSNLIKDVRYERIK